MQFIIRCIVLMWFFSITSAGFAQKPTNFAQAKRVAAQLFRDHQQTLYCQCSYDAKKRINLTSCGMQSAANQRRATRVEWEHMLPAEQFGHHFPCWRERLCLKNGKAYRGRRCCQKMDGNYRQIEAELYNLWPAVGLVNQARSNYRYSVLPEKKPFYGCAMAIDKTLRKVEPPDSAKGTVARANLFVADFYGIALSQSQRRLFEVWNKQFPPAPWEKAWGKEVATIEGYSNPYLQ